MSRLLEQAEEGDREMVAKGSKFVEGREREGSRAGRRGGDQAFMINLKTVRNTGGMSKEQASLA